MEFTDGKSDGPNYGLYQLARWQESSAFVVGQGATTIAYPLRYAEEKQRSTATKAGRDGWPTSWYSPLARPSSAATRVLAEVES